MIIDHEDLRPQYRSAEAPKAPRKQKQQGPSRSKSEIELFHALRLASGDSRDRCRENPAAVAAQVVAYRASLIEEMQNCYGKIRVLETQALACRREIEELRRQLAAKPVPVAVAAPAVPRQSWFSGVAA